MYVFDQMREWIEDGALAPAELVKDVDIARKFGVSRTPVREALQMLEQLGLVETEPGRHTRVANTDPTHAALIYPPLAALVVESIERAAPMATPADFAAMGAANERLVRAIERADPDAARAADNAFHSVLITRADNPYLTAAIDMLRAHSRRLDSLYFTHDVPGHVSCQEHTEILEALKAGDFSLAKQVTRQNFIRTIPVFSSPEKMPKP
jgi:DNA-binding GntR family transcriptional regulator